MKKNSLALEVLGEGRTRLKPPIYAPLGLPVSYLKLQSIRHWGSKWVWF